MSSEPDIPPTGASSIDPESGRDRLGPLRPNHGDRLHDLQLLRDLAVVNARTHAELGPLPPGGLPAEPKRKAKPWRPMAPALPDIETEDEAMKFSYMTAAAVFSAATLLTTACRPSVQTDGQEVVPSEMQAAPQVISAPGDSGGDSLSSKKESAAPSSKGAKSMNDMPDSVAAFVRPGDTLLAYKTMDLTDDGSTVAVAVIRHGDISDSPSAGMCDLLVLHEDGVKFRLAGKSAKIVDCEFNEINQRSGHLGLNSYLELSPSAMTIKFTNENIRGGFYSYSFAFSDSEWRLSEAESAYKEDQSDTPDVDVFKERAVYPDDFGLISIDDFDPDKISAAMRRNKSLVP